VSWLAVGVAAFMVVFVAVLGVQLLSRRRALSADEVEAPDDGRPASPPPPAGAPDEAPRATGWIRTRARPASALPASIQAHAALTTPVRPVTIEVTVAEHPDGFVVVDFPEGVPAYVLCNLVGWIDDGAGSTVGYLTPPDGGVRYALAPDADHIAGDTLRGAGSDGSRVQVYLPDGTVQPVSWADELPEPERAAATVCQRLEVTVDGHAGFGNPRFRITGTPPPVPTTEASRVDAALRALATDPSEVPGLLFRPDPAQMPLSVEALEAHAGGTLRFATSELHDSWLLVRPDGSWVELSHLGSDGAADLDEAASFASGAHVAADLLVRASEEAVGDEELRQVAHALGLPAEAAAWVRQGGAGDYDTWKANLVQRLVAAVQPR